MTKSFCLLTGLEIIYCLNVHARSGAGASALDSIFAKYMLLARAEALTGAAGRAPVQRCKRAVGAAGLGFTRAGAIARVE